MAAKISIGGSFGDALHRASGQDRPMSEEPSVNGAGALYTREVIRERLGAPRFEEVCASLAPADRQLYEHVWSGWLPLRISEAVLDGAADALGADRERFAHEVILESSGRTIARVYRVALRFAWEEALVARTPALYRRIRNVGSMEARFVQRGAADATLTGWALSPRAARSLASSFEAVLLAAGKEDVVTEIAMRADGARFRLRWR